MIKLSVVALVWAILAISANFAFVTSSRDLRENVEDYEYYMFATEWSPSACQLQRCIVHNKKGIFNIHGLWPSRKGDSPELCKEFHFTEQNIDSSLKKNLYDHWSGLFKPNWDFVKYELKKHGTCWRKDLGDKAKMNPEIQKLIESLKTSDSVSEFNVYMRIAIFLSDLIHPLEVLKAQGIVPSDTDLYDIYKVVDAINRKASLTTGVVPICKPDKNLGIKLVVEMRFCLDLNYNMINCDPMLVKRNIQACGNKGVGYPVEKYSIEAELM